MIPVITSLRLRTQMNNPDSAWWWAKEIGLILFCAAGFLLIWIIS